LGHPDLIPIRTDEFTLVVRLLHKLSIKINQKWGETISDFYHRTSPAGALCRQICAPPATYLEKSHDDFGKRVNRLPARIVLRPLASYRVIFYLCLFFFVSLFIFGKSSLVTLIILFFGYFLYISVNAFVLNPIDPDNSSFLNESFRSHEKWN
jgi:sphingomyelin phosphodiesterase 4